MWQNELDKWAKMEINWLVFFLANCFWVCFFFSTTVWRKILFGYRCCEKQYSCSISCAFALVLFEFVYGVFLLLSVRLFLVFVFRGAPDVVASSFGVPY